MCAFKIKKEQILDQLESFALNGSLDVEEIVVVLNTEQLPNTFVIFYNLGDNICLLMLLKIGTLI